MGWKFWVIAASLLPLSQAAEKSCYYTLQRPAKVSIHWSLSHDAAYMIEVKDPSNRKTDADVRVHDIARKTWTDLTLQLNTEELIFSRDGQHVITHHYDDEKLHIFPFKNGAIDVAGEFEIESQAIGYPVDDPEEFAPGIWMIGSTGELMDIQTRKILRLSFNGRGQGYLMAPEQNKIYAYKRQKTPTGEFLTEFSVAELPTRITDQTPQPVYQPLPPFSMPEDMTSLSLHADGKSVYVNHASHRNRLVRYEFGKNTPVATIDFPDDYSCIYISPDTRYRICAGVKGKAPHRVALFDLEAQRLVKQAYAPGEIQTMYAKFSPDMKKLVIQDYGKNVLLFHELTEFLKP